MKDIKRTRLLTILKREQEKYNQAQTARNNLINFQYRQFFPYDTFTSIQKQALWLYERIIPNIYARGTAKTWMNLWNLFNVIGIVDNTPVYKYQWRH